MKHVPLKEVYCKYCDEQILPDYEYCPGCGAETEEAGEEVQ